MKNDHDFFSPWEEEVSGSTNFFFAVVVLIILACLGLFGFDVYQSIYEYSTAPKIKVQATITDKLGNDIYFASPDLPKKGDRIQVNDYDAGRLRVNDSVCVQYQNISIGFPRYSSNPQYGIELCPEENFNGGDRNER